ncbi:MAG: hypothetical protein FWB71_00875 [Defluviitaleaceae bacterium]|nr:hypothetical protein [Defluviitaleaceae bacterium]
MIVANKMSSRDAERAFPEQWIVFVEIEHDPENYEIMGIVHMVTSDMEQAYATAKSLQGVLGDTIVISGENDWPQIGDLCSE